jgi:hypothetical protein
MIDCNNWAPHNKSNIPILITDLLINANGLFVFFAWFYYRLGASVIYHFLNKDGYFHEDN